MTQNTEDTALRARFAKYYPSATEIDITRMIRFQRGDDYTFHAPPVCTGKWGTLEWSRAVTFK